MKNYNHLKGIIAPIITPWTKDEKLDENKFREQAKFIINAGVHGISPGGSTGEGNAIRDDERCRMIEIIKEVNTRNIPIVAGIIRHSTRDALVSAHSAKKAGADALMITPLQYLGGTDDNGNYEYYKRISNEVGLPIIIYNVVPQNEISPKLAFRLLDIENVIGIKQSVGGIHAFAQMKQACGGKGLIYAATDELMFSTYELGADGAIAAILGLFPELCVRIWDLYKSGDHKTALQLQEMVYPIWMNIIGAQFPRRLKAALKCIGRDCGIALSPLSAASDEEFKQILDAVKAYLEYEKSLV